MMAFRRIEPLLSTDDIERDLKWHQKHTGFEYAFGDKGYAGMERDGQCIHLQWHHNNQEDPVLPAVVKIFVDDIEPYIEEFLERGTITKDKIHKHTPWGTHEFGFFDLNKNPIYIVQDI